MIVSQHTKTKIINNLIQKIITAIILDNINKIMIIININKIKLI